MTLYHVQRCLFDYLRRLETIPPGEPIPAPTVDGYRLDADERAAILTGDVDALYRMGTHPVLINGYCRAMGWKRADYRVLFVSAGQAPEPTERPRWLTS